MPLQITGENKRKLQELVKVFHDNIKQYKSNVYDEANTKTDFIDKLFEILDWDVRNTQGFSEDYREVVREDKVQIEGKPGAPDYSFKIGKERKFFVEAKKPIIKIKEEISPAYQVRRYGYTAKLPLSILTDFEEFAVYDTRIKPIAYDSPATARIFYCTYDEYEKHFDFIYNTFSKTALLKGSFDQYIAENKNKKGTSEVDKEFLKLISEWRELLAKNIALRNSELDIYSLNNAIQKIIDRIIFLRIAEDRGTENYGTLSENVKSDSYKSLVNLFKTADRKYNSDLFKDDDFLNNLVIDDTVFKKIIKEMYYPDCPYEFSVLPIEVLGNIYEQFLGKTIRLTTGHQAKIEEKPEVRKAGGVYYTPQYIVNYIVENTVGEKIKGKTPEEIIELRILDPACGSGSFLIGAYTYLLDYHINYYTKEKRLKKSLKEGKIYQVKENDYHLTTGEKQRILLNTIFGVDIDPQAVEVTKLSLLLKLMEYETIESRGELFKHSDLKILPNLLNNIKCGNSLIGSDFYTDKDLSLFGMEEMRKVNAFDWEKEFAEIMGKGGFDVVIGNPPYIQLAMFEWFEESQKKYLLNNYCSSMGRLNTFGFFIEKGIKVLNLDGFISYIIPNTLLSQEYYQEIRQFILKETSIKNIVIYEHLPFTDAIVENITFILNKNKIIKNQVLIVHCNKELKYSFRKVQQSIFENSYKNQFTIYQDNSENRLKNKIEKNCTLVLKDMTEINQAIALKHDRKAYLNTHKVNEAYKPVLDGREINRYFINWSGNYLKYDLNAIHSCKREDIFNSREKIFFRRVSATLIAALDSQQFYALNTLVVINLRVNVNYNIKYILALFNSKLLNYYYVKYFKSQKKVFSEIQARQIGQLPIKSIDFTNPAEKARHDSLVFLVDQMLETQKLLHSAKTEADKKLYQQKADLIDKQIDTLVYKLYDLTEEEIKIVEGNS